MTDHAAKMAEALALIELMHGALIELHNAGPDDPQSLLDEAKEGAGKAIDVANAYLRQHIQGWPAVRCEQQEQAGNTPIEELMREYQADGCDFSDLAWVRASALRLAQTMPDSQARCLLYALAAKQGAAALERHVSDAEIDAAHDAAFTPPLLDEDRRKVRAFARALLALRKV